VATRALADLHGRYNHFRRNRESELIYQLSWLGPGRVWAMDYMKPPRPIDGIYKKVLDVRDLASGKLLDSLPVPEEAAFQTRALLERLFAEHGAPLVLKCDNGSPLMAEEVRALLDRYGVTLLLSPPYWPRYNGACEAGHGSLKVRAHHLAAANGRVTDWSSDDLEGARLMANELARPRANGGLSPDAVWDGRSYITPSEREAFQILLQNNRAEISIRTWALADQPLDPARGKEIAAKIERDAVRRTLEKSGLLVERRRRIPLRK